MKALPSAGSGQLPCQVAHNQSNENVLEHENLIFKLEHVSRRPLSLWYSLSGLCGTGEWRRLEGLGLAGI